MYTSKKKIRLKILLGILLIIISIIIILYIIFTNYFNSNKTLTSNDSLNSLNYLKQKVQEFQKGNAAANKNNLECYVNILYDNLKLNVDTDIIYNILQSDGLKADNYKDGLLTSISILSKALNKNKCYVYKPLITINDYNNISKYTIFNSNGLQEVFKNDKDPVGSSYTEYSFLTFIYFLNNLYLDKKEKNIIPLSNNLKLLNQQLIRANAFKTDKQTGKIIIPYNEYNENKGRKENKKINTTTPIDNKISPKNIQNKKDKKDKESSIMKNEKIYIPLPIFLDNSQNKYNYFNNNVIYKDKIPNSFNENINPYRIC